MKKHCFKVANAGQIIFAMILSFTYCSVNGQNLCEQYGDTNTDIIIQAGENSSQYPNIDGLKVKVLGDFTITEPRTFTDVIFEFGTNGRILGGIDHLHFVNCKLYSCTDSWKGIVFNSVVTSAIDNKYFQFRDCELDSYIQIVTTNANFSAGRTNFYSNNYNGAEAANLHLKTTTIPDLSNTSYFICNFYSSSFNWVKVTGPVINTALPGVSFTTCTFIDLGSNAIVSENCDFNVSKSRFGKVQGTAIIYNGNGNVRIYNDNSFSSTNNGIIITNAKTSIVDDCSFTNTNRAIEIHNHPTIIKNCDYVNNIPTAYNWFAHLVNAMYSKIVNNGPISNISSTNSAAIIVRGGLPEIVNNTISGSGTNTSKSGLNLWNTSGGYIANNSISNLKNDIRNCPTVNVFDNTISNTVHQVNCLNVTLTSNAGFCRNSLNGATNLNFSGNCMDARLVDNHFLGGTIGLNVNNVIGLQDNRGNTWAETFPTFGATNTGNPQASLIYAKIGYPYTPFHSPLGWFIRSFVEPNLSCLGQQITMLKPEEKMVIDGNYDSTPLSIWMAKVNVYRTLSENPDLLLDVDNSNWYTANEALSNLVNTQNFLALADKDQGIIDTINILNEQIIPLLNSLQLYEIDSPEYDSITIIIQGIESDIDSYFQRWENNRNDNLYTALNFCSQISPQNDFETNFKDIYSTYINKELDPTNFNMSQKEIELVTYLAELCPEVDGNIVFIARELIGFEALVVEDGDCVNSEPRNISLSVIHNLTIIPNPSEDKIKIESNTNFKYFEVLDMNGRLLLSTHNTDVNLSKLVSGIYLIKAIDNLGASSFAKFVKL